MPLRCADLEGFLMASCLGYVWWKSHRRIFRRSLPLLNRHFCYPSSRLGRVEHVPEESPATTPAFPPRKIYFANERLSHPLLHKERESCAVKPGSPIMLFLYTVATLANTTFCSPAPRALWAPSPIPFTWAILPQSIPGLKSWRSMSAAHHLPVSSQPP